MEVCTYMTKLAKRFLCLGLAIICCLSLIPATLASAADDYSTGGWVMMRDDTEVLNADGSHKGKVYALEGVTLLSTSGSTAHIQYSTSNGAKDGYVSTSSYYDSMLYSSCVAVVKRNSNTYYSPSTELRAGSVNAGEIVAVIASDNSNWYYIEYNTTKGRKRAYIARSNITTYFEPTTLRNFYQVENPNGVETIRCGDTTVFGGPSTQYATIGSLYQGDEAKIYAIFMTKNRYDSMVYISYKTTEGKTKYGYIYIKDYY